MCCFVKMLIKNKLIVIFVKVVTQVLFCPGTNLYVKLSDPGDKANIDPGVMVSPFEQTL